MIKHYMTKYQEDGKQYAEAWLQIDLFNKSYCFSKRRIEVKPETVIVKEEVVIEKTVSRFDKLRKRRRKGKPKRR